MAENIGENEGFMESVKGAMRKIGKVARETTLATSIAAGGIMVGEMVSIEGYKLGMPQAEASESQYRTELWKMMKRAYDKNSNCQSYLDIQRELLNIKTAPRNSKATVTFSRAEWEIYPELNKNVSAIVLCLRKDADGNITSSLDITDKKGYTRSHNVPINP